MNTSVHEKGFFQSASQAGGALGLLLQHQELNHECRGGVGSAGVPLRLPSNLYNHRDRDRKRTMKGGGGGGAGGGRERGTRMKEETETERTPGLQVGGASRSWEEYL